MTSHDDVIAIYLYHRINEKPPYELTHTHILDSPIVELTRLHSTSRNHRQVDLCLWTSRQFVLAPPQAVRGRTACQINSLAVVTRVTLTEGEPP
jgi:hypothetical protein